MRFASVDVLRTLAIVLMVLVHFVENLSGGDSFVPGGFAAPLFAMLSGVSYRLWLSGREARGANDAEISKITIRRGLFLFGVGFLFNVLVWLPEDTFNWDILTLIGAGLLFLNVVRKMPDPITPLLCGLVYAVSPLLRVMSNYPAYWTNDYFECDLALSEVLLGFLVNGYFPVFPWIIYPVAGFAIAPLFAEQAPAGGGPWSWLAELGLAFITAAGLLALSSSLLPKTAQDVWFGGWNMFPASPIYVLATLGMALAAVVLGHRWIDHSPRFAPGTSWARAASVLSAHSFSMYLLHHVVHLWPLWIYGTVAGQEPTEYWRRALPEGLAWLLAIAFLLGSYFLFRWMQRRNLPGVEGLMRWLCD